MNAPTEWGLALLIGVAALGAQQTALHAIRPANEIHFRTQHMTTEPVPCEEDMPCWDCETMGNGICGLTPSEDAAERSERTYDLPATL